MNRWHSVRSSLVARLILTVFVVLPIAVASSSPRYMGPQHESGAQKIALRVSPQAWPRLAFKDVAEKEAEASEAACNELGNTQYVFRSAYSVSRPGSPEAESQVAEEPRFLARGDLNEDGIPDLIVFSRWAGQSQLSVTFGHRTGDFCGTIPLRLEASDPIGLAVEDFNLDGHLDAAIAYADASRATLLIGTGFGGFDAVAHFDIGENARALVSGDFNDDGRPDLVIVSASPARVAFLEGRGPEGFSQPETFPFEAAKQEVEPVAVRAADLDGDGALDVAVAYRARAAGITVFYGVRERGFRSPISVDLPVGSEPSDLVLADFNFDRVMDLAVGDTAGTIYMILGHGNREFSSPSAVATGGAIAQLTSGHFDGDGYPDVAAALTERSKVVVLLGDGKGGFSSPIDLQVISEPVAVLAARLNRDALDDLVIGKRVGNTIIVALTAPSAITVTTTADNLIEDGKVTLREAILAANGAPPNRDVTGVKNAPDVITFNLPEAEKRDGVFTIAVDGSLGPLPELRDGGTTIDGTTQPGFSGTPLIVLSGRNAGVSDGLTIISSVNVVAGLVINGFQGSGVKIIVVAGGPGSATGNIVRGCYLGTDPNGQTSVGNGLFGVIITRNGTQANLIGGTSPADRNIISGNKSNGIELDYPSFGNIIAGNYIGTTADGLHSLPNGGDGVFISGARDNLIGGKDPGAGNVISGNVGSGVQIVGIYGNQVLGNLIGLDASGARALPNGTDGVTLAGEAHHNTVGGLSEAARNIISGNAANGIRIARASANEVLGNFIGTDKSGSLALPNSGSGVLITSESHNNLIGGAAEGAGNVISGNGSDGVTIALHSMNNQVIGNLIGTTTPAGTRRIPNGGSGVNIIGAQNNQTSGNTIAYNTKAGVQVLNSESAVAQGNRISGNSIFANGGLGIDLNGDGVTANDSGDIDSGPNQLMNFPVVTDVTDAGSGAVTLRGRLDTLNPTAAQIEVYLADPDPSGFGEGKVCLAQGVTPSPDGTFAVTVSGVSVNDAFTLTAADEAGNTSEFSHGAPPVDTVPPTVQVITPNGGEFVSAGTFLAIAWQSSDNTGVVAHELALSIDGGQSCVIPIGRVGGDQKAFAWVVPENLATAKARVCVTARDGFDNLTTDTSDADFTIFRADNEAPFVRVLKPNGGEIACAGCTFTIQWQADDNTVVSKCDLLISTDGGASFNPIVERLAGDVSSYEWNIPAGVSTTRARLAVRCRDVTGNVGQDLSDADFSIDGLPPTVASVTIDPFRALLARQTMTITWTASDDAQIASQRIEISKDNGKTWEPLKDKEGNILGANLPGDVRVFKWTIPLGTRTAAGRIRVTATDTCGRSGQGISKLFSITSSP